jgi:UDP-glucose 4-epimerase
MRIFVTGGAGYVGSHCVKGLCEHGHAVVVYDDLSRGHRAAVHPKARLIVGNLGDRAALSAALSTQPFDAAMHFAAFAYVGESVDKPLAYYRNNTANTLTLLEALAETDVRRLVFSSTCASYGTPDRVPIPESTPQSPINPYGRSKLAVEWMLADSAGAWGLGSCALRYFNACGAAADATIGEDHEPETHLIPIVLRVAMRQHPHVSIFGTDYETPDGTCVRDYIHVEDLAEVHRLAIEAVRPGEATAYNVGTGAGCSVREIIEAARRVTGLPIAVKEGPRRPGDPPRLIADASRIRDKLGWQARWTNIDEVVRSAWRWHQSHPAGFADR